MTTTSYTAQWQKSSHAAAYLLTTFDGECLEADIKDYSHVSENFSSVEVGSSDYDNPVKLGGFSEIFFLDEYTSVPGWYGAGVIAVDGKIGCAGCWYFPGMYGLITPHLSLGGNGGNYKVHLKVWGCEGSSIVVASSTKNATSEVFENDGMHDVTLELSAGTFHDALTFYTTDGQQFLIEEVNVVQDLAAGELILTPKEAYEITDGSTSLAGINHVAQPGMVRAYDVMAARVEFTRNALSDYSAPVVVKEYNDGVESVNDGLKACSVYTMDGCVVVDTPLGCHIEIFGTDGSRVISEEGKCGRNTFRLNPGVYIVKVGNKTAKVLI